MGTASSHLSGNIGLCMSAGGVTFGFDRILGDIRSGRAKFVLISSDASERTLKQITDKCAFYKTEAIVSDMSSEDLASAIGKRFSCSSLAFTGRGPWKKVHDELIEKNNSSLTNRKDD